MNYKTLFAASPKRLHIPYRYTFLLVLSLRLVPLFDEETNITDNAQRVRGIPVDQGILRRIFRRLRYTFLTTTHTTTSQVSVRNL